MRVDKKCSCGLEWVDYKRCKPDFTIRNKERLLEKNKEQLAKAAKKKLKEKNSVHPDVKKHWEMIAGLTVIRPE